MGDFTIKNPPEYNPALRQLETTDPNHADVFNALFGQLINNEAFLEELARRTAETLAAHREDGVVHVTAQQKQSWDAKAGTAAATQAAAGLMAAADKKKLDEVSAGAEVNQNAYSSIRVGSATVTANGKTATVTLEAGSNVTLSADNAAKKITVAANRDGGNADMLDGYHAAHFAAAGHGHAEVDELKKSVSDGKTSVAAAVTAKGVTTAADATFATIAENVGKISADATATDGEVLSGKTFYAKGQKITGKMTNRGAVTQALNAGGSYIIPAGYHNGSGKVTANSLASQTAGTAEASDIASGKTAWVNGAKVTGGMKAFPDAYGGRHDASNNQPFGTLSLNNNGRIQAKEGGFYYKGFFSAPEKAHVSQGQMFGISESSIKNALGITADKIVQGNTILGVAGTGQSVKTVHPAVYNVNSSGSSIDSKPYIKMSDIVNSLDDFSIMKIVTKAMFQSRLVIDQLYFFTEFSDDERISITAVGNRTMKSTLAESLIYSAGTASDNYGSIMGLKALGNSSFSSASIISMFNHITAIAYSSYISDVTCTAVVI